MTKLCIKPLAVFRFCFSVDKQETFFNKGVAFLQYLSFN